MPNALILVRNFRFTFLHSLGHNRPVGVTFQLLLVGRLAIELSGRYSASKLMTALAQPGQMPPIAGRLKCLMNASNPYNMRPSASPVMPFSGNADYHGVIS